MEPSEWHSVLVTASCICLDVDSTVVEIEGIDELAKECGVYEQVKTLTSSAMGGAMLFEDSLTARLDLIKPSYSQLNHVARKDHPLSPGVEEFVHLASLMGIEVFLVSGGFTTMVEVVAKRIGVPMSNIFANKLEFDEDGGYTGFDETCPTSKQFGKQVVAKKLKKRLGDATLVFIGDGVTDLEAKPPADLFIGFGGVQVRDAVKEKCDAFVYFFSELVDVLKQCTNE